jgi:hypothetical protein
MVQGKIVYQGTVLDNDDPLRLGRLRVLPEIELLDDIKESIPSQCKDLSDVETNVKQTCKWKENDPFVILPLLPFSMNITPKKGELVYILYPYVQDPSSQSRYLSDRNRFYLPTTPSTPLSVIYETDNQTKTNSIGGENYKQQKSLKEVGGQIPKETFGVFPEPDDNALLGRGTSDLILQQERALLRAGKTRDLVGPTTNLPTSNEKRAFLDLARFLTTQSKGEQVSRTRLVTDVQKIKLLIEYDISNPENQQDSFTGNIYIYNIDKKGLPDNINTKDFKIDTNVDNWKGVQLSASTQFKALTSVGVSNLINQYIRRLNEGLIDIPNVTLIPFRPEQGKQFPFVFRPHPNFYKKMVDAEGGPVESNNLLSIFQKVGLTDGSNSYGFGIVSAKDTLGPLIKIKNERFNPITVNDQDITYGTLGAQKLYLLSHDSQIGDLRINLKDTIYGITPEVYLDIESKTEPMVRGEKLMELLELIVKFLVSHVHPYHGLAAVPVGQDGTQSSEILQKLLDAPNTILNQNIRIN